MNTRVNVTLDTRTYDLVSELAELRNISRSALLREFLSAYPETFEKSIAMMKLVHSADPETMAAVNRILNKTKDDADFSLDTVERILR